MNANYICPHCRSYLNVADRIVIAAKNEKGRNGVLLFSIHLGDYEILKHSSFEMEENEQISFFCPCCKKSLRHEKIHENIYRILMHDEEDQEYQILFSGIYGERCTYQVSHENVYSYGEHASKYLDFANLIQMS
ncbi:hypothetical protein [Ancylomarina longa]|uniref:Uncharacterized protein n=1 Tax=Ancylomarina longa TaxID=2487017 RepID=A0A434AZC3_9BACT|nr:hypothetical protein [Ancylomarina longa]RUT79797.1 hypothetical protein DLK05_00110 [Ancylomarina longa]